MIKEKQNISMLLSVLSHTYEQIVLVDNDRQKGIILNQSEKDHRISYEEWCHSYFGQEYRGDDRNIFLQKIRQDSILDKLIYDDEYIAEFSVAEKGRIRRKQFKAFTCQKEKVLCVCISDITQDYLKTKEADQMMRKSLEIAQNSNVAREQFLKEMQQEIRGPIYSMKGMLEQAMKAGGDQSNEYICKADSALTQYSIMIEQLLSMSAVENGQIECQNKVIFAESLMQRVQLLLENKVETTGVNVNMVNRNWKVGAFEADPMLCRQVMFNAIDVLMEYTAAGGVIKCILDFDIQNTAQKEKKVFDFLFSARSTSVSKDEIMKKNSQIMNLMQRIVDRMDGIMSIQNIDDGTEIFFRIPVRRAEHVEEKDADIVMHMIENSSARDFSDYRALVVDDDLLRREVTVAKLECLGLEVETASDGQEAIDMIVSSSINYYQILFMNPILPNKTGLEVTMELREMERHDINDITIVALTSNDLRDERIRALEHGMDYHLLLPMDEIEIKEILIRELQNIDPREEHEIFGFRVLK